MRQFVSLSLGLALIASMSIVAEAQGDMENPSARPIVLPVLYASFAFLEGVDVHTTMTALHAGFAEANPMLKSVTRYPASFLALKTGVTVSSIVATERLWKRGNRRTAIFTMVASNAIMGYVAAHNVRAAHPAGTLR